MSKVYLIDVMRSPICKTNGAFAELRPETILKQLIDKMYTRMSDVCQLSKKNPLKVEDVIIAHAVGLGGNISRLATLSSILPKTTPATSIDFQCGGSLKALEYGFYSIKSGHKSLVLVGGLESTSLEPRVFLNKKDPEYKGEVAELRGKFSPQSIGDPDMLEGAEHCYQLLKPDLDMINQIVLNSHQRAHKASQEGLLDSIICPIKTSDKLIEKDEGIRPKMSLKLIKRAKPIVMETGYTSVANSCLKHDGASLMMLADEKFVKKNKLQALCEIIDISSVGIHPKYSPLGALVATRKIMADNDLEVEAIGVLEVNEAFAIKTWTIGHHLNMPMERINPLGGGLAYGHPYGATGGILMSHLSLALKSATQPYGIATMGVAGGQGISVLVKKT